MPKKKEVYIVGGPNGSGKTTFVKQFLPNYVHVRNFVNADDIAVGLSPLNYSSMNITSGKLMLELIEKYRKKGESFGFETTLSGKKWVKMIKELKASNYNVYIFFLHIASAELAVSRVKYRVESGGHDIPESTIRRRYVRSMRNFWYNYKESSDGWYLFDNSSNQPELMANHINNQLIVVNRQTFESFQASIERGLNGSKA